VCLPPNSSHALQPLDVGFFKPLKTAWRSVLRQWYRESRPSSVCKATFPSLLNILWSKINVENAKNGFRGAGIFPLDASKVSSKVIPSISFDIEKAVHSSRSSSPTTSHLKKAVINVLSPITSEQVASAIKNSKSRRKRVQAREGEILTEPEALARLLKEAPSAKKIMAVVPRQLKKICGDGNCLFACFANSFYENCTKEVIRSCRIKAVSYNVVHWAEIRAAGAGVIHDVQSAAEYFDKMSRDGEFGDEFEVAALAKAFNVIIEMYENEDLYDSRGRIYNSEGHEHGVVRLHYWREKQHYDLVVTANDIPVPKRRIKIEKKSKVPEIRQFYSTQEGSWVVTKVNVSVSGRRRIRQAARLYIGKVNHNLKLFNIYCPSLTRK
jgi:hypothetical protein